jgi:DNA-binding NtrC family response regulator
MNTQRHSQPVILCIDDPKTTLELNIRKRVLETAGYRVLTATSACKALEIFRENQVDLVLTEQVGSSGFTDSATLAAMKMLKPDVPIAIYSADWEASPEHMRFADTFITKLVSVDELLCTIEGLLAQRPRSAAA